MEAKKQINNSPDIIIEGMEEIIDRDLVKFQGVLEQKTHELLAYREARSYLVKRKREYNKLLEGDNNYNKDSLKTALDGMVIDLRQMSDKVKLTEEAIEHFKMVVDDLAEQKKAQDLGLKRLNEYRNGSSN